MPVFPIIGVLLCGYLMSELDRATWIRFLVWLVVGLAIYFLYSARHSRLRNSHEGSPSSAAGTSRLRNSHEG